MCRFNFLKLLFIGDFPYFFYEHFLVHRINVQLKTFLGHTKLILILRNQCVTHCISVPCLILKGKQQQKNVYNYNFKNHFYFTLITAVFHQNYHEPGLSMQQENSFGKFSVHASSPSLSHILLCVTGLDYSANIFVSSSAKFYH